MTLFVAGRLSATPIQIDTTATLQELRLVMSKQPYSGLPGVGWGNVEDPIDDVGRPGAGRPITAKPQVFGPDEKRDYPERLLARFYYDELDRRAVNRFRDADEAALHVFKAADIAISELPGQDGSYLLLTGIGPSTPGFTSHLIPCLRRVVEEIDPAGLVRQEEFPLGFPDNDFFKWLLYRTINDPDLGGIHLDFIRHIDSQDGHSRGTAISGGADIDRPELLALVSANYTAFGPVKVKLNHDALDVIADIEIRFDGSYAIKTADSVYGDARSIGKAEESLRLIQDVGYRIIPELTSAWLADSAWTSTHRSAFTADARQSLIRVLAPSVAGTPCAACGKTV